MGSRWIDKSLAELGRALRSSEVLALDLFEEAREAHEKFGGALSAYRIWDEQRARAQAGDADAAFRAGEDHGPLQGIPVSVKDLFGLDYLDTFAGSPKKLPDKWTNEGPFITAIRKQMPVITGKTHMVEFAFGGLGANAHWPIPRNPWDAADHRAAGGSSSGAGVSLIEGSALVALGTDTAGSVRVPASVTGTVGLKVTAGRWPIGGIVPLSPTLDTPGFLTRSVADAALVFELIDAHCAGRGTKPAVPAADLGNLRAGIAEHHFWDECDDDIAAAVQQSLGELEAAGMQILPIDIPETDEAFDLFRQGSVVSSELSAFLDDELPGWLETADPNIAFRMSSALDLDAEEIRQRRVRMDAIAKSANARLQDVDIVISPTVPVTAPKLADIAERKAYSRANLSVLRNTCIANLLKFCAITLPVALDGKGMPVGLQCIAPANAEVSLLGAALAIEGKLGTGRERLGKPPLAA